MSYANVILYSSVLPSYGESKEEKEKVINGDDPKNMEEYNKILFGQ